MFLEKPAQHFTTHSHQGLSKTALLAIVILLGSTVTGTVAAETKATETNKATSTTHSTTTTASSPVSAEDKTEAAWDAAEKVAKPGPAAIDVAGQATLQLPKGYEFIPKNEANNLMQAMGNTMSETMAGMVVPTTPDASTMYVLEYNPDGHIDDKDAKDLKADDILANYKEGTEEANKERTAKGFPALEVKGWGEQPQYDATKHRLTWALIAHDKGVNNADNDGINYETRLLGREGYVSMTMLGDAKTLAKDKIEADQLSSGLSFNAGRGYEDYKKGDHLAEYGLAALITGVAAKKLGLIALIGVFIAKFAKIIGIAVFAAFPFLRKIFKRKNTEDTNPTPPAQ